MKALEVITDGFEDLETAAPISLLKRAGIDLTVSALHSTEAKGRFGSCLTSLVPLSKVNIDEYDLLVLPGGPEYMEEEKDERFLRMIEHFAQEDKYIAAICAAPTILGHLGLLKGKKYTCFTSMNEDFGGEYVDTYSVIDGKLITGRSPAAAIEFALSIVKRVCGEDTLKELKESIYY